MCGIFGRVVFGAKTCNAPTGFEQEVNRHLRRRGPDHQGEIKSSNFYFYHSRLALVDLTDSSNQPLKTQDGRYVLTFNGEIYNFASIASEFGLDETFVKSDTRLLLELLELGVQLANVVHKFDGMFAIAVFDCQEDELILLRDRFGEKPLFYHRSNDVVTFSSSELLIAQLNGEALDASACVSFIKYGFFPPIGAVYKNVVEVPPQSMVTLRRNREIKEYWEAGLNNKHADNCGMSLEEEFHSAVLSSIESRLTADVEVGIFLSGGVDSAVLATVAKHHLEVKLPAFSIYMEGSDDESSYIEELVRALRVPHFPLKVSITTFLDNWWLLQKNFDRPFSDTSGVLFSLLSEHSQGWVKAAITGDGADEVLWGYPRMRLIDGLSKITSLGPASKFLYRASRGTKLSKLIMTEPRSYLDRYYDGTKGIIPEPEVNHFIEPETPKDIDLYNYLRANGLVKADRASMAYGFEIRCPYLANEMLTFQLNHRNSKEYREKAPGKLFQRSVLKKILGADPTSTTKRGFSLSRAHLQSMMPKNPLENLSPDIKHWIDEFMPDNGWVEQLEVKWRLNCLIAFCSFHGQTIR